MLLLLLIITTVDQRHLFSTIIDVYSSMTLDQHPGRLFETSNHTHNKADEWNNAAEVVTGNHHQLNAQGLAKDVPCWSVDMSRDWFRQ